VKLKLLVTVAAFVFIRGAAIGQCPEAWSLSDLEFARNPWVSAATRWDPDGPGPLGTWLVVAGEFFEAGGQSAARIAAWDGIQWHTLGAGFPLLTDIRSITSLVVFQGRLIAGGQRASTASGNPGWLASWGAAWTRFEPTSLDAVKSLRVHDGHLVVATTGGIRAWDGAAWTNVGTLPYANSIVSFQGQLMAATYSNGSSPAVWRWQGQSWEPIGAGLAQMFQGYGVHTLLEHRGELFAAGDFTVAPFQANAAGACVARWTDGTWVAVGAPPVSSGYVLASAGDDLVFSGDSRVWAWDGATWRSLNSPIPMLNRRILAASFDNERPVVCGDFSECLGDAASGVAAWNGSDWTPLGAGVNMGLGTGNSYPVYISATMHEGELIVSGSMSRVRGQCAGPVLRLTPEGWRPLGQLPLTWAAVEPCGGRLVGYGYDTTSYRFFYEWRAGAWSLLTPAPEVGGVHSRACFEGQPVVTMSAYGGFSIRRWTGSTWTIIESPSFAPRSVAVIDDVLYALGWTSGAQGNAGYIAAYDGSGWNQLGSPLAFACTTVAAHNERLVCAGNGFSNPSGAVVAEFDGSEWRALGTDPWTSSPYNPSVGSLLSTPRGLVASGQFSAIGGLSTNSLARWDGVRWEPMNSGIEGLVPPYGQLLWADDSVLLVGNFKTSGGLTPPLIARWRQTASACYPNCDCSSSPALAVSDFGCFIQRFLTADPYANCDQSTAPPVVNLADFTCFLQKYAAGCP
jgi:trimeric autotransporter adhesin